MVACNEESHTCCKPTLLPYIQDCAKFAKIQILNVAQGSHQLALTPHSSKLIDLLLLYITRSTQATMNFKDTCSIDAIRLCSVLGIMLRKKNRLNYKPRNELYFS
jgi:hypothetical protein